MKNKHNSNATGNRVRHRKFKKKHRNKVPGKQRHNDSYSKK